MEDTRSRSTTTEISEVTVMEIVNSDYCKVYEVKDTPFNVRHFLTDDNKETEEVVICIGDEAIAKYQSIEGAMGAIKRKDWQLILVGACVYGNKMNEIKMEDKK